MKRYFRVPGEIVSMRGEDRVDLLHRLSTNDLRATASPHRAIQTLLTTSQGKLVDWITVWSMEDELLLFCSPGRGAAVVDWLDGFTIMEDVVSAVVERPLERLRLVDAGGAVLGLPVPELPTGVKHADFFAWRSGPGWPGAVELVAEQDRLTDALAKEDWLQLHGSDSELLRIVAGVPSPAHEFARPVNPLELRLKDDQISFSKGCYVGQEVIARLDSYDKVARVMMGWESAPAALSESSRIVVDGAPVGKITSSIVAERRMIGLAIVKRQQAVPGEVQISTDSGLIPCTLLDRAFWNPPSAP